MATPKIIPYEVQLRSTKIKRNITRPVVYTNDLRSAEFQFQIIDMQPGELTGATATTLLYMRDGSFFQNPKEDVILAGTTFSYLLKENEGNHAGVSQIQLVVKIGDAEFASQLFDFEVINGLDSKVAQEIMIHDWTTLTREARAYIDEFAANEILREAEFDNNEFDRNAAFVVSQDARTLAFGTEQTNRGTAFTAEQNERTTAFNESESGRTTAETGRVTAEDGRVEAETDRVTEEDKRVTAESNRVTAEGNRVTAETGRVTAESGRVTAETNRAAAFTAFNTRLTAEETATAANKISAVKSKTFADVDARFEDVEFDTTMMGTNLVPNGDFSSGTTGWSASDSVNTVSANTLINTGNGAQTFPTAFADSAVQSVIGKKVYVCAQMRVTNANCSSLQVMIDGATAGDNQTIFLNNPVQNTWYKISGVLTQPSNVSGVIRLKLIHQYADSATANGKVMESKYIIAIDLTNVFGAGNEPTVEQMDGILAKFTNSWFNGTANLFRANATLNKLMTIDARTEFDAKNLVVNGDFSKDTNADGIADSWVPVSGPVCTLTNGEQTVESVDGVGNKRIEQTFKSTIGSKYYVRAQAKMVSGSGGVLKLYVGGTETITVSATSYTNYSQILTSTISAGAVIQLSIIAGIGKMAVKNALIIDLTATFGAGKEPTLAEMDRLMARYPNSWFDGTKPIQTIETLYQEKANKVQEAWITPTLLNGHVEVYPIRYMKDEMGFVHVKGRVTAGGTGVVFTLPVGYRPLHGLSFFGTRYGYNTLFTVEVGATGSISILTAVAGNVYELNNIYFRAEQ